MTSRLDAISRPLGVAAWAAVALAIGLALFIAPMERTQGNVQRIFYMHLPLIWVAYFAFLVVFVCSILYLWRREEWQDHLARSSAEIGLLFTSLVLVTGSIWARPVWGTWWTWDPRLTTTLMLWFIYAAYVMLHGIISDQKLASRYAAVLGIIGFLDVPIIHQSVVWWRGMHPQTVVLAEGGPAMPPIMLQILVVSLVAFSLMYAWLLVQRLRLEALRADRERVRFELLAQEG